MRIALQSTLVFCSLFLSINLHAQQSDTSKRIFQLGQVNINGIRDSRKPLKPGAFNLTSIKANLMLPKGFTVEAGANNLFDRNYTLAQGYPEQGRNFFANLIFNY
ncbi:TonB-dependent receptor [Pedobacter sp. MC2016-14]|uniref:TonB-dependent receptor n=1 Tax=Pedobacter sp. MC2016-14 TaxID=2897327 RepID=UPI001E2F18E3|nr:TonB-dependent receptor [Pedobacter sp. MC2016-14]MCD0487794.1 TonB-dependent receptor [Pedobacter sp. MC2016-14]